MSDTQQESKTHTRNNFNQTKKRVKNGQRGSLNTVPLNRNIGEPSEKGEAYTRTRYGRIVQKPDRHIKSHHY